MKIRGNTIGTPMKPDNILVKAKNLTEAEKRQARENIGAWNEADGVTQLDINGGSQDKDVGVAVIGSGGLHTPILSFGQAREQNMPILRDISDGVDDYDAATVGQLKGKAEALADDIVDYTADNAVMYSEEQNLTDEQKAQARENIGALGKHEAVVVDLVIGNDEDYEPGNEIGVVMYPEDFVELDDDEVAAVLSIEGWRGGEPVILRGLAQCQFYSDAANKGYVDDNFVRRELGYVNNLHIGDTSKNAIFYTETQDGNTVLHLEDKGGYVPILRGVAIPKYDYDAVPRIYMEDYVESAIEKALANLPVYNGEVEEV